MNKLIRVLFVVVISLLLFGCTSNYENQAGEVTLVIEQYWTELTNGNYSAAKNLCINGSEFYQNVDNLLTYLEIPFYDFSNAEWISQINWVKVSENRAVANISVIMTYRAWSETLDCWEDKIGTRNSFEVYLVKENNSWKFE